MIEICRVNSITELTNGEVVAIDGKTLRGVGDAIGFILLFMLFPNMQPETYCAWGR